MNNIIDWTNLNSGFLALILFITTLLLGWLSGIFEALRHKPSLVVEVFQGPNMCVSFDTPREWEGHQAHRTAIAIYIAVTNIGSAPTDIKNVHVGYKSHSHKMPGRWFWLKELTVARSDFVMEFDKDSKAFPFLMQRNQLTDNPADTYLLEGKRCNGMVYFEQEESWGSYLPISKDNKVKIKVRVFDIYGKRYSCKAAINKVTLKAAQSVCEKFGETRESLVENKP